MIAESKTVYRKLNIYQLLIHQFTDSGKSIEISIGFLHSKFAYRALWSSIKVIWSFIELYGEFLWSSIETL
jgi:hypothetical protein